MPRRPIYVDIDGTLTHWPRKGWGPPRLDVIEAVKKAIKDGHEVVLWSAGGAEYARQTAEKYGIKAIACMCKPGLVVDNDPHIRPPKRMRLIKPEEFVVEFGEQSEA